MTCFPAFRRAFSSFAVRPSLLSCIPPYFTSSRYFLRLVLELNRHRHVPLFIIRGADNYISCPSSALQEVALCSNVEWITLLPVSEIIVIAALKLVSLMTDDGSCCRCKCPLLFGGRSSVHRPHRRHYLYACAFAAATFGVSGRTP